MGKSGRAIKALPYHGGRVGGSDTAATRLWWSLLRLGLLLRGLLRCWLLRLEQAADALHEVLRGLLLRLALFCRGLLALAAQETLQTTNDAGAAP
jgi:hypothetical protein